MQFSGVPSQLLLAANDVALRIDFRQSNCCSISSKNTGSDERGAIVLPGDHSSGGSCGRRLLGFYVDW
jgi:hypothetical protein